MSATEPEGQLDQLHGAARAALGDFESRVREVAEQVEGLRAQLELERQQMALAIEDLSSGDIAGDVGLRGGQIDTAAIAASERALVDRLRLVVAFQQRIGSLSTLVAVGSDQLDQVADATAELDALKLVARAASIRAQEAERYRLAREIHDGPAQVLANAILGLELCEQIARRTPASVVDELVRLKSTVREGLIEVRRFIFDLRPSTLAERGLLVTLQRYVAEYANYSGIHVDLQLPSELATPAKDDEITLFRVVQESLQNVQKHARATQVTVRLAADDRGIVLEISDDGRGFTVGETEATTRSGAGLGGMKERAAMVGGELTIDSAPGAGTTVTLRLPHGRRDQWQAVEYAARGGHK